MSQTNGKSQNADRTLREIAECKKCVVYRSGWRPREWTIEACERHSALLDRESDES